MGDRIAFVVNAAAGPELAALNRDSARVYTLLTDPDLGQCDTSRSPGPLHDCPTASEFESALRSMLDDWQFDDQLILYFSGHGVCKNRQYALKFGCDPRALPFKTVLTLLTFEGVKRAILVLDTCHSGAALTPIGERSLPKEFEIDEPHLPKGLAIIASCREYETSHELKDRSAGVFTELFCKAIQTGLGGRATENDLIGVSDIVTYVSDQIRDNENYAKFGQHPIFQIHGAEGQIWISANKTQKGSDREAPDRTRNIRSKEELIVLYQNTAPSKHPCVGATRERLDWDLVERFAKESGYKAGPIDRSHDFLRKLGLYSELSISDSPELHMGAVLCFCSDPLGFYPQARALFKVGKQTHRVRGPLSLQFQQLFDLVKAKLDPVEVTGPNGLRREEPDIPEDVIREVISNAIAHRDYSKEHVVVELTGRELVVSNPGTFPANTSWETFIANEHAASKPRDEVIATYVTFLLAFEGVGQGFKVFREHRRKYGEQSIVCDDSISGTVAVRVRRGSAPVDSGEYAEQSAGGKPAEDLKTAVEPHGESPEYAAIQRQLLIPSSDTTSANDSSEMYQTQAYPDVQARLTNDLLDVCELVDPEGGVEATALANRAIRLGVSKDNVASFRDRTNLETYVVLVRGLIRKCVELIPDQPKQHDIERAFQRAVDHHWSRGHRRKWLSSAFLVSTLSAACCRCVWDLNPTLAIVIALVGTVSCGVFFLRLRVSR